MGLLGLEQTLLKLELAGPEVQGLEQLELLPQGGWVGFPQLVASVAAAFGQLSLASIGAMR